MIPLHFELELGQGCAEKDQVAEGKQAWSLRASREPVGSAQYRSPEPLTNPTVREKLYLLPTDPIPSRQNADTLYNPEPEEMALLPT